MISLVAGREVLPTRLVLSLLAGLVLACLPTAALAHAKLDRSQPKANETISVAPKLVELWFSEALESGLNTIEVKDQTGKRVDRGEVVLAEGNKMAQVELGDLSPGVYTVVWKALSADQHAMRGSFTFTLAASSPASGTVTPNANQSPTSAAAGAPHSEDQMPLMSGAEDSTDSIRWGQTLVRWVSYISMMLLFGGFAFRSFVLIPALRRATDGAERIEAGKAGVGRILQLLWLGAILLAVTSVVALVLQASDVFDKSFLGAISPSVLAQVLGTGYGPSWILQLGALTAITLILLLLTRGLKRHPEGKQTVLWWAGLVAGAALLIAPSWTGHAMVSVNHFRLAVLSDWLHLLAGGFWVGGLAHLALASSAALSKLSDRNRSVALHHLIRSFTRTAMPSVALLVLAGLYNTWAHVPSLRALWVTPYGQALLVKLSLVLLMLALGAINNYHFGKRAARLAQEEERAGKNRGVPVERSFYRSVAFEASLGLVVLLVTAVLVFLTPARNHPAMDNVVVGETKTRR
jgi:copper transport protein